MYQIKKEEVLLLIENMRQIRQKAGEIIALLEHLLQLQQLEQNSERTEYDPDDYLSQWINGMAMLSHSQYADSYVMEGEDHA